MGDWMLSSLTLWSRTAPGAVFAGLRRIFFRPHGWLPAPCTVREIDKLHPAVHRIEGVIGVVEFGFALAHGGDTVPRQAMHDVQVALHGGGALGHPRVFLNMGDADHVDCPYCGRRYVLQAGAAAPPGH